jgi:molybdate transport system substrate-binding protein
MQAKRRTLTTVISAMLAMILAAMFLVGCSPAPEPAASASASTDSGTTTPATSIELQIFAANSLEKALPEVQALYTKANPEVTFADTQFKSSGDLVTSLQGGAPADILITASAATMDTADTNGSIDSATRKTYFNNDLVVVKQTGSAVEIKELQDVNSSEITKIAIGDDSVPAGTYARQSLNTIGLYSDASGKGGQYEQGIGEKAVDQSSVGNVAKTVSTGDCQIGFVYTSDLYRYSGIETAFTVPADSHKAIVYPGAVVKDSKNAKDASDFLAFCLSDPEALKIWAQYGFELAK